MVIWRKHSSRPKDRLILAMRYRISRYNFTVYSLLIMQRRTCFYGTPLLSYYAGNALYGVVISIYHVVKSIYCVVISICDMVISIYDVVM